MAIDTENKRRSAGSLSYFIVMPEPDGSVDTEDRPHASGIYSGLSYTAVGGPNIRNTQTALEVQRNGAPNIRDTQTSVEVLRDMSPAIYNTQCALEVLRSNLLPPYPYYYQLLNRRR